MREKNILFGMVFLMVILSLSSVSSLDKDYIGKQYTSVNLIETCSANGFPCDSTYSCRITIADPDHRVLVMNQSMTRNQTIYNYSFTDTSVLGTYITEVFCGNGTFSGVDPEGVIKITTTGRIGGLKTALFLFFTSLGVFLLGVLLRNFALGFLSGILFLVTGIYMMVYGLEDVANLYTQSMSLISIAFGGIVTIAAGIEWLEAIEED